MLPRRDTCGRRRLTNRPSTPASTRLGFSFFGLGPDWARNGPGMGQDWAPDWTRSGPRTRPLADTGMECGSRSYASGPGAGGSASRLGHWPRQAGQRDRARGPARLGPDLGGTWGRSMAPLTGTPGPPRRRWTLAGPGGQPNERAVGKFEIPAVHLDLAFPAAFSFDHKFGPDRKTARQTV